MSQRPRRTRSQNTSTKKKTGTQPNFSVSSMSKPLSLNNLEAKSPDVTNGLTDTSETIDMSQFQPLTTTELEMMNLLQQSATGTSGESESNEKPKRPDKFSKLQDALSENFAGIGLVVCAFNMADGQVILARSNPLAEKLVSVARQNPKFYEILKNACEGSAYMALVLEVGTIAQAILTNHGKNPLDLLKRKKAEDVEENHVRGVHQTLSA